MDMTTRPLSRYLFQKSHLFAIALALALVAHSSGVSQVINPIQAAVLENGSPISPNLAGASAIAVQGNYAYVVSGSDVLEIFDISLPGSPLHKSSLRNGDGGAAILKPSGIVAAGNYVYIANNGGYSLETIDVSDPSNPVHKATLPAGSPPYIGLPQGIQISGNYLFIPSLINWTVQIVDITNPALPTHKGFIPIYPSNPHAVVIRGTLAYVAAYGRVVILDITNPASPTVKSSIATGKSGGFAEMRSLAVVGNYVYAVDRSNNRLEVIDVSNANAPTSVATFPTSSAPWVVNVSGSALYIGGDSNKMDVFDIATPALPVAKTGLTSPLFGGIRAITINGTSAYIADQKTNSMVVVDITSSLAPTVKANVTTTAGFRGALLNDPQSVYVSGNFAYVADRSGNGLEIVDVTDPSTPLHLSSITNGTGANFKSPTAVSVSGNFAYVVGNGSLEIVDVTNPAIPAHKSFLNDGNGAAPYLLNSTSVFTLGNFAYITSYDRNALEIVNISNPAVPSHAGFIQDANLFGAQSVYVSTIANVPYAFVASALGNKLVVIDVSNPAAPVIRKVLTDGNGVAPFLKEPMSVFVADNYAYVVSRGSRGLEIVDVSTPANAVHKGFLKDGLIDGVPTPAMNYPRAVHVSGNTAFVASGYTPNTSYPGGLEIIDVTDRAAPKHLANLNNLQQGALLDGPTSLFVAGNYLYVTNSLLFTNLNVVYLYGPAITGFTPTSGPAGTSVTLTGQNFNTFLTASIDGTQAKITSVNATSLTLTIPEKATVGTIQLTYSGQSFQTGSNFFTTPAAGPATNVTQTGFTANWSDVDAAGYFLDVSPNNNFSSFVTNFNGRAVGNVTSFNVTGLAAGTSYFFRVRSAAAGVVASNTISVQTIPATPTVSLASAIKQNSFSFSWNNVLSATGYSVDVATDNTFSSILGNYSNLTMSSSSINVNSLDPGQVYFYRVRASNASGSSPSSAVQSTITIPANPVATNATNVSTSGVTANWIAVQGATSYYIDVSTDNFATFVPGYANVLVSSGTSFDATLASGTPYQYRVRASNSSGKSDNSNIISILTLTPTPGDQPTALNFSNVTRNSVNVSFTKASSSPAGYIVVRAPGTSPNTTPTNGVVYQQGAPLGNATVAYIGASSSFFDTGLPTSLTYFYSVYAYNGVGVATNYNLSNPLQGNITLDVEPPVLTPPVQRNPSTITSGNTPTFNVTITDNVKVESAQIFYRGISKGDFASAPLSPGTGSNYSVQVQADWYDSLGIEYYFIAADASGNASARPASSFAQTLSSSLSLPVLPSGADEASYRIVSFPYQLSNGNNVSNVYPNVPWNDNTKAGLWWWNPVLQDGTGDYDQFGNSAAFKTIDPGKGYWMITRTPVTPQLTNVPSPAYNRTRLFQMTLKPGWNQIGNPYPVEISWDDVTAYNTITNPNALFGPLTLYTGNGYKTSKTLPPFTGGFVKNLSTSDITIEIPFKDQVASGGRKATAELDISNEDWKVGLLVEQDGKTNELGGFGMNRLAKFGEDRFDNFNPPKFFAVPQLKFAHPELPAMQFAYDVVPSQTHYGWTFAPEGTSGVQTVLRWDNQFRNVGGKQLILFDEERLKMIDMAVENHYEFTLSKKSSFRVFYGDQVNVTPSRPMVSAPFPNPLNEAGQTSYQVALPDGDDYRVTIQIYNPQGIEVTSIQTQLPPGLHPVDVSLPPSLASGMYIYRLSVTGQNTSYHETAKVVKP